MKKRFKLCAVLMAAAMAVSMSMTACGDSDSDTDDEDETPKYEQPIENYVRAINKGDGKALEKCFPDFQVEYYSKKDDDYLDEYAEELNEDMQDDFGEDFKISYKVNEKEELDEDDIESYTSKLENYTDDKETEIKLTEGYKIKTTFKVKGSEVDSGNDEEKATYIVGKVNGKWVILDMR